MKKMILFFALVISLPSFAQDSKVPPVRFGNIQNNTIATTSQVLSFPRLLVMNPTCVVKGFTVSFISGKNVSGPYKTDGPALTEAQIAIIKKMDGTAYKIAVDDIRVSCNAGKDPEAMAPAVVVNVK